MSLVLYRKYRPRTFAEIIGQEHIVQTLTNAIKNGMISHAYLFIGPRGSGKTTIARLLAKAVNCKNLQGFEPCNKCSACMEINNGRAMDLIEIDAASNRGIDDIRELREGIRFSPTSLKYKVFILDEAHQLSKEAANALLKTLEEPPAHAIFILATTEAHKMIPTIISRCQRFDFKRLTLPEIMKRLELLAEKEKIKVEKPALELIAINSRGSFRDAESLLDQVITFAGTLGKNELVKLEYLKNLLGMIEISQIGKFVDFLTAKQMAEAINFLNELIDQGSDPQEFLKSLIGYLRQILIFKMTLGEKANPMLTGLSDDEMKNLAGRSAKYKEEDLKKALNLFLEAENKMRFSTIIQLPIELAIVELCVAAENTATAKA